MHIWHIPKNDKNFQMFNYPFFKGICHGRNIVFGDILEQLTRNKNDASGRSLKMQYNEG